MATASTTLRDDIEEIMPGVIADRRHFHQHPELGFEEFETAKFVTERLQAMGIEDIRTGIAVTGVTGLIRGTAPSDGEGPVVLLRADMDALPIHEENDVDYCSMVDGKMHACGHDAHTAMLLGIARTLNDRRSDFSGTVKLLFQPAEESGSGAKAMVEQGALDDPAVDYVFGMHLAQDVPLGKIELRAGPVMAAADFFTVVIHGKGGHGAQPHLCIDPISAGAQIVAALQTIVSREIDPTEQAVVTVGAFLAGEASNVIPDSAELRGTLRAFTPQVRKQIAERVESIVTAVASALGATVDFTYLPLFPSTTNNPEISAIVTGIAKSVVGPENVSEGPLHMGAEDFSYFLERKPGCFYFVGSRNDDSGLVWGHHHPRFDIDEASMTAGMEIMVRTVLRMMNGD